MTWLSRQRRAEKLQDKAGAKANKAAIAVDEGRDRKADRLYKRAARLENRGIKIESALKDIKKTTKGEGRNFRTTEEGAGMTAKGVASYKAKNPGSNLQTAVTGDVKPGSKADKRRKAFCARSKSWTGERGRAARRRWRC